MEREITRMVLMGVSGCGKSTVGRALSERTGVPYLDGDDLHPPENIAKMERGEPLDDADRDPWLRLVGRALRDVPVIVGCSALKRRYRDILRDQAGRVLFVHLSGSPELIAGRMGARTGHFMPPALLASQFAALEPPQPDEEAITVDIDQPLQSIVEAIATR